MHTSMQKLNLGNGEQLTFALKYVLRGPSQLKHHCRHIYARLYGIQHRQNDILSVYNLLFTLN
jgi:hypothetical protein